MLFNSYFFIFIFLPLSLVGYYLLSRFGHRRLSIIWLILVSLVFYGWYNSVFVLLLLASILFNYSIQKWISVTRVVNARKLVLAFGITTNIALLGYFKYVNFFVANINVLFKNDFNLAVVFIPLAISFFTIQQITYLVDTYRAKLEKHDLLEYCLFVTFFPKLISGPIMRFKEMIPQITGKLMPCVTSTNLAIGFTIFFLGLFAKAVIADNIGTYVDPVFSSAASGTAASFFESWAGALSYTFQLYFDFAGYSNMAIGLGLMFGFRLPLNFFSPYKATSIIDFWRRWHMTLSRFIRDYLYIPLGGNRKGAPRQMVNLMIAMIIAGIWHGAGWTFIIWGALHGLYLVINHSWSQLQKALKRGPAQSKGLNPVISVPLTLVAVTVAWVFFRAESVGSAINILSGMAGMHGFVLPMGYATTLGPLGHFLGQIGISFSPDVAFSHVAVILIFISLVICWVFPNVNEYMSNYSTALDSFGETKTAKYRWVRWEPSLGGAVLLSLITLASIFSLNRVSSFIYAQF